MDRGFSLIEVLVASVLTAIAIITLAQLSIVSIRWNQVAQSTTVATIVALQKMEQLRVLSWRFDPDGTEVSDSATDTTTWPERPSGGTGLAPSPPGALDRNVPGYCDFLDRSGALLGGGAAPPAGAVFVRRWSIDPLSFSPDSLLIQVFAGPIAGPSGSSRRAPEAARLVGLRTRKSG